MRTFLRIKIRAEINMDIEEDNVSSQVYDTITQILYDDLYIGADDSMFKDLKIRSIHTK